MHAIADAFLQDIIQSPGDDFPRLAFADWLDESGEEARASFIRCQLQLAQLGECGRDFSGGLSCCCPFCCAGGPAMRRRERELLVSPGAENVWCMPMARVCDKYGWRRGFVGEIAIALRQFEQHAAALFAAAPLEAVRLTCRVPRKHMNQDGMWGWYGGGVGGLGQDQDDLPRPLWDCLESYLAEHAKSRFRWYATEALAREALSRAAVRWGRSLANLPEAFHE